MEKKQIRLFVALDIPGVNDDNEPIQFANTQLLLCQAIEDFKPVSRFHITVLFIGSVLEEDTAQIKSVLARTVKQFLVEYKQGIANGISGFMLEPGASLMGKNAVVMKLVDNYLVIELASLLSKAFKQHDLPFDERASNPILHITLGRVSSQRKKEADIKRFLELLPAPIGGRAQLKETFSAPTLTLYQSLPNSEYIPLVQYKI